MKTSVGLSNTVVTCTHELASCVRVPRRVLEQTAELGRHVRGCPTQVVGGTGTLYPNFAVRLPQDQQDMPQDQQELLEDQQEVNALL